MSDDLGTGAEGGTSEIVRLADIDPRHPGRILAEMRAYWDTLRQGQAIPSRADVDPKGIRRMLDFAFILERIAPGAARFRLAGRHLIDLMGMEVRGMPLCAFFNPAARGGLSDLLETVFIGPQLLELEMTSPGDYGRPALRARMLILPLRSDLGDVTRALGCFVAEGEVGRAPRRFDIDRHEVSPVIPGARTLAPQPGGFAEGPNPWTTPRPEKRVRPPHSPASSAPPQAAPAPSAETPEQRRARFHVVRND